MTSDATQLATDITKESASAEAVAEVTETTADAVSLEETAAATTSHRVLKLLAAGTSVVFSVEVASKSEADQLIASGKISQSQLNAALTRRGLPTVTSFVENPSFTEDVEYYTKEKANSISTGFIVRLVFRVLGMVFVLAIGAYFLYTRSSKAASNQDDVARYSAGKTTSDKAKVLGTLGTTTPAPYPMMGQQGLPGAMGMPMRR